MSELKLSYDIHKSHAPLWTNSNWRYAILMGGRGNGRSGSASRYCLSQLVGKEYTRGTLMRAVGEDIRNSCWQAINDRIFENTRGEKVDKLKLTDGNMIAEYGQNSLRAFGFRASSGNLTARLKSIEGFNLAWIEEADEISEEEFTKFDDSLRTIHGRIRIVLTLNCPPKDHWIIKRFFNLTPHPEAPTFYIPTLKPEIDDAIFIHGTWRENEPNMDAKTVARYQKYKEIKPDHYWHMIEGLVPETVHGRIYKGWKKIPEIPHNARLLGHFLDFGNGAAPDALGSVYYHNGGYIVDERYYKVDNSYNTLIEVCKLLEPGPIVADSAEDRMIKALREAGVNIIATDKGPGSVEFGIKHVQGLRVSYTASSANFEREYEHYAWLFDKDGNNKNVPDPNCKHKFGDHLLDGWRYFATKFITAGADPEAEERERVRLEFEDQEDNSRVGDRLAL